MPSHNLLSNRWVRNKPWKARVKVDWQEFYLGHHLTREEAEKAEEEFRNGR